MSFASKRVMERGQDVCPRAHHAQLVRAVRSGGQDVRAPLRQSYSVGCRDNPALGSWWPGFAPVFSARLRGYGYCPVLGVPSSDRNKALV